LDYEVKIAGPALAEAEAYIQYIQQQSHDDYAAQAWWDGLLEAILSLEVLPGRCSLIPERFRIKQELRHLLYASHRIIFRTQPGKVTVLRIYHTAQSPLRSLRTGLPRKR
jgi:hypothetical protein